MKTNKKIFNIDESVKRMNSILDNQNIIQKVNNDIDLSTLDYYKTYELEAACISISLHINTNELHQDLKLYKQYKCLLSEFSSIMNEDERSIEFTVNTIHNFSTLFSVRDNNIAFLIDISAKIISLLNILNIVFINNDYGKISIGIGVDFNKIYVTREGFDGSGINEVLWSGDALDNSYRLSSIANIGLNNNPIMITKRVFQYLPDKYKAFFNFNEMANCYHASLVNNKLKLWMKDHL